MNTFIKYWSYLVENEDGEISFETFLKKESLLFEAEKKWPDAYLKQAKNLILNSSLGKSDWYLENYIDQDLQTFYDEFKTFASKGSFALGFFPSIIKWFIEYSGSDINKYQEFIEKKLDKIIGILNYIVSQKDDEISQFHGFSKEKDKDGNPLVLKFKKLKDMNWLDFEKEIFQKYSDEISNSVELKTDVSKESDYEIVPIYSYEELNKKFGGDKTGYKGKSEWCHTNGRSTYKSWAKNGKYMFIVFAKRGWENITPPDPSKTTTAYDDYGTSLIACLFDTGSKELLNSTLRWNHVIDPAKTKIGTSVDRAFKNENDLMNTVGIDLSTDLDEYFTKFKEIAEVNYVTIGGKDFEVENENFYCNNSELTSLEGAPQEVSGDFYCYNNKLTSLKGSPREVGKDFNCFDNQLASLEGAPQKVGRNFICSNNQLTSLEGTPREVGKTFNCSNNQLTSLEGGPQKVGEDFGCSDNKLTSLKGAPQKINGNFWCYNNKLTSLEGAPEKVGKTFICSNNQLTSLEGVPKEVSEDFECSYNQLTSLEGCPQKINGSFWCYNNKLTSLEGAPEKVGGSFNCSNNQLTSLGGAPMEVSRYFDCSYNQLTSLEGAPKKIGKTFSCSNNPKLPEYKIKAYKAYLKLSNSEKAPLTKDNHYYPTEEWENKFK